MNIGDLIAELEKFPELSRVFVQYNDTGEIHSLDSVHEVWVKTADGSKMHGPYIEIEFDDNGRSLNGDAEDFGILLYG